jgi:small subunit ribosomal protein S8
MMSKILNAELIGKHEVTIPPYSKQSERVLGILKEKGYLEDFKPTKNAQGGFFVVSLNGKINKCGVVAPNFNVKKEGFEPFEKRFLPAKGFGILILTTPKGLMTHNEAKEKGLGGRLLGYCY